MRNGLLLLLTLSVGCELTTDSPPADTPAPVVDPRWDIDAASHPGEVFGDDDDATDPIGDDDDSTDEEVPVEVVLPDVMADQITLDVIPLPEASPGGFASYGTFEVGSLNPRSYHAPLDDGRIWAGWRTVSGTGTVARIDGDAIDLQVTFPERDVHGLVAIEDGGFGVLLRGLDATDTEGSPLNMWLGRYSATGTEIWTTKLTAGTLIPYHEVGGQTVMGDSRLAYGNDRFVAYYTVYNEANGHHGDQVRYVDANGTMSGQGWDWGCSHSTSQLVSWHPAEDRFVPLCVSDTYPAYGVMAWRDAGRAVFNAGSAENGLVSAVLGGVADRPLGGWIVSFNAVDRPIAPAQGAAIREIDLDGYPVGDTTWLTETYGEQERDTVIARVGPDDGPELYLVGWRVTTEDPQFMLGIIDPTGAFVVEPQNVFDMGIPFADRILWGRRDDSFRRNTDGSVTWTWLGWPNDSIRSFRFALDVVEATTE